MQYTTLKGTGIKVSKMCLGTMTFGDQADKETSRKILDYCLDNGVNFLDTADIYTRSTSESWLGEFLQGKRDEVVLATKVGGPSCAGKNGSGLSRKHIMESVDKSLQRLQSDYIDVLYCHFPDFTVPTEEVIYTMDTLIRAGKIRYYGISNFSAWLSCEYVHTAREMNMPAPVVTESVYNLITRGVEDEMLPFLDKYPMGLTVFNPLAGGLLSGKHSRTAGPVEGTRMSQKGYNMRYWNDRNWDAIELLTKLAEENGMTLLELSYRWLLGRRQVTSIITGVSKFEHTVQNLAFYDSEPLPAELEKACDEAWDMLRTHCFNYHH